MRLVREDFKETLDKMYNEGLTTMTRNVIRSYVSYDSLSVAIDELGGVLSSSTENLPTHIGKSVDMKGRISFATKNHCERYGWDCDDADGNHNRRVMSKVGKFLRKIFTEQYLSDSGVTNNDIELFVVHLNQVWNTEGNDYSELKCSDNIAEVYHQDNYCSEALGVWSESHDQYQDCQGSLGGSCMKKDSCQEFFSLYDSEGVKVFNKKGENYNGISSRALLWDSISIYEYNNPYSCRSFKKGEDIRTHLGVGFMDRIYTVDYLDESYYKDYAKSKGLFCKEKQSYRDKHTFIDDEGNSFEGLAIRRLNADSVDNLFRGIVNTSTDYSVLFPYMDTFSFGWRVRPIGDTESCREFGNDDEIFLCNSNDEVACSHLFETLGYSLLDRFSFEDTDGGYYKVSGSDVWSLKGDVFSEGISFNDNYRCVTLESIHPQSHHLQPVIKYLKGKPHNSYVNLDTRDCGRVKHKEERLWVYETEIVHCKYEGGNLFKSLDGRKNKHLHLSLDGGYTLKSSMVTTDEGEYIHQSRVYRWFDVDDNLVMSNCRNIDTSDFAKDFMGILRKKSQCIMINDEGYYNGDSYFYIPMNDKFDSSYIAGVVEKYYNENKQH